MLSPSPTDYPTQTAGAYESTDQDTSSIHAMDPPPKSFIRRKPVRLTIYTGFILLGLFMLAWGYLPVLMDPTYEKHIADKSVLVGMTRQQALEAWGSPYQMNVTYTNNGIRREEWIYEDWIDAGSVQHRYLYFEEGKLVGGWYYE